MATLAGVTVVTSGISRKTSKLIAVCLGKPNATNSVDVFIDLVSYDAVNFKDNPYLPQEAIPEFEDLTGFSPRTVQAHLKRIPEDLNINLGSVVIKFEDDPKTCLKNLSTNLGKFIQDNGVVGLINSHAGFVNKWFEVIPQYTKILEIAPIFPLEAFIEISHLYTTTPQDEPSLEDMIKRAKKSLEMASKQSQFKRAITIINTLGILSTSALNVLESYPKWLSSFTVQILGVSHIYNLTKELWG